VYRHFETRQALMAAVAAEVARQLATPPVPADPHGLRQYPAALFGAFEKRSRLTREALHTELFEPVRDSVASERWRALRALLHEHWPAMPSERLDLAAVNLRYLLAATTWNYHRRHLGLDAEGSVAAVAHALACILDSLGPPGRRPAPKGAGRASRMP
jgi:AcrR family transcriptional regulator